MSKNGAPQTPWQALSRTILGVAAARTDAERAARVQMALELTRQGEQAAGVVIARISAHAGQLAAMVRDITGGAFVRYEVDWGETGPPRGDFTLAVTDNDGRVVRLLDGVQCLREPAHAEPFVGTVTGAEPTRAVMVRVAAVPVPEGAS